MHQEAEPREVTSRVLAPVRSGATIDERGEDGTGMFHFHERLRLESALRLNPVSGKMDHCLYRSFFNVSGESAETLKEFGERVVTLQRQGAGGGNIRLHIWCRPESGGKGSPGVTLQKYSASGELQSLRLSCRPEGKPPSSVAIDHTTGGVS